VTGSAWRVGVATAPFPVPTDVPLGGYLARSGDATGTHDPLEIGALTLHCDESELTILNADVVALDRLLVERIQRAAGLADGQLLACASHTHSGPAGIAHPLHPAWPPFHDEAMRDRFTRVAVECIAAAWSRLAPAELTIAHAEPEEPVWRNRNDPDGPADRRVTTLVARRPDGAIATVLLHFACHPTVLGQKNLRVSADLVGAARRSLAARLGTPTLPILFANGAAGDVSTRFTRKETDFATCNLLGDLAGQAAQTAIIAATAATPIAPSSRHGRGDCHLDRASAGSDTPAAPPLRAARVARSTVVAHPVAEMRRRGLGRPWPESIPIDAWLLGDELALVAIPGELTAVPGWLIESSSPFPVTRIIGYANGYVGYLPDLPLYDAGTYEALASPYAPGCGERVTETAISLLDSLA
jgi:hypothetical protein